MRLALALLSLCVALTAGAQDKTSKKKAGGYPPVIEGTKSETYRKIGDTELKVWIFEPRQKTTEQPLPAIVFFFGGGWTGGSPTQFEPQSRHLAAATATLPGLDNGPDDKSVSCVPNALVLFNPGVVMAPFPGLDLKGFGAGLDKDKFGCEPTAISPLHHVKKGTPPTIIFHGKADTTVPYTTVEKFTEVMKAAGNRCELVGYEGQPHGFFNKAKYAETLAATDAFLVSLGYLPAK
jgi:acetyl esterase/lipase